ncbi:hypothetical protein BDV96DRAFT_686742 [Lophiotrema nucula]|uniref:Methyltransferase n=1 Tax=Lophiotrema nucula TaxID=690887 RepID=A0A6A5ZA78_9PLEO|nr:hypothetical protein BDV96DRAFT_686742 [Lophiotrema nucula]
MAAAGEDISTSIDFVADLPLYREEKLYFLNLPAAETAGADFDSIQTTNIQWNRPSVKIQSMRDKNLTLDRNGFCYLQHGSEHIQDVRLGAEWIPKYRKETEDLLRDVLKPDFVLCYNHKIRKNAPIKFDSFDPTDPTLVEETATGAHDISVDTVPRKVSQILSEDQRQLYLQPDYRIRLVNTWRPLLPVCEDRPLALCDYTSMDPTDLLATDRVYPTWVQEIYYLKHNPKQRWFWLPKQTSSEPFLFLTFDSHPQANARYCPHVSVDNPLTPANAPPRESIETRSIVISRIEGVADG